MESPESSTRIPAATPVNEPAPAAELPIVNISAYLFTPLDRLNERRAELRERCQQLGLKGTILLAPEGINLFLAGSRQGIDTLVAALQADPLLQELKPKESYSRTQPFNRLLVKRKAEIIAFGQSGIHPEQYTSPRLSPAQLKQWLDEGRPVTLLDTRNDYEVELGTFDGAIPIGVDHFRDFPEAVQKLPEDWKQQPIVTFCTGGIRCEKAAPYLEQQGFREVYQLDGGILKYFEECGADHYHGECFVFDQRVAVDPELHETATTQCYLCQHPLTPEDQLSPQYHPGVSCPYCPPRETPPEWTIPAREARLQVISQPLPGSTPYTNARPLNVPARYHDWTLIDFLHDYHPHLTREEWQAIVTDGLIRHRDQPCPADCRVREGQRLIRLEPNTVEPDVNPAIRIVACEEPLLIIDKPAPLPVHPCGRFCRNTLTALLELAFPDEKWRPAHRLDANTTGLIVLTNRRDASLRVQRQFERGSARKTYLCRVTGEPAESDFVCDAPISRETVEQGARRVDPEGAPAITEFHVRTRFPDGTTLLAAHPRTGRTNQIRVHLWHLGWPVLGDSVYLPGQQFGTSITRKVTDSPMCLHAWQLEFRHPFSDTPLSYSTPLPDWAQGTP